MVGNEISDIKVLEKVKFEKLEKLYLNWNIYSKTDELTIPNLKNKIIGVNVLGTFRF